MFHNMACVDAGAGSAQVQKRHGARQPFAAFGADILLNGVVMGPDVDLPWSCGSRRSGTPCPRQQREKLTRCTLAQVEEYASSRGYPEAATFSAVLQQFALESQQEQLYFLCSHSGMLAIARATDDIPDLSLRDRAAMCTAPVDEKNKVVFNAFLVFINRCVPFAVQVSGPLSRAQRKR